MKQGWTTTRLITVGGMGVLRVLIWVPFVALNISTSSPVASIFSFFFFSFVSVFSLWVIGLFGTVTAQTFIEWTLELPMPSIAFMPLMFAGAIVRAIIVDIVFQLLRAKQKTVSILCGGLNAFILSALTYTVYLIMGVPGAQKIPAFIFTPLGLFLTLSLTFGIGGIGGLTGFMAYRKMAATSVVRRIQKT
jgi:hypothetical protein